MGNWVTDRRFYLGFVIAHLLLFFTFEDKTVFWYIFTASMLILISFSIIHESIDDNLPALSYFTIGILSGTALFLLFWAGNLVVDWTGLPLDRQITKLYRWFSPELAWHYIVLILIIAPGEEIFWRGFIQKRILESANASTSILVSALMYASVHFYSGQTALMLAALVAGLVWGSLYAWKRSIPLVVISHIVFDLLLFILFPLR
ncbi:CPBP family intramembrane glutamic endopeptidase [Mesobacillus zeae]|uniref:CPBP family intramembrane metalloprotease n=1 Tax=Mesobacillus zeae TaxID=1917180 RepID=A0A398BD64_9BACI|nr:CPBP family intramembrane glutamic endopeptidase [Mesobacillus zeae]RID87812.1 CPBP family intramembrane metalloprotease [Mesobacillus zeae]